MENYQIKKKILLVDDEPDMLTVNSELLASNGYQVLLAKDGFEALEIVNRTLPNLILLDLMIPGVDGFKLCGILKHNKHFRKIPIIIISARNSEQDQQTAKLIGANEYITKPFEPQILLAKIEELLTKPKEESKPLLSKVKSL